jgi:hypothetical protein
LNVMAQAQNGDQVKRGDRGNLYRAISKKYW